MAEREAAAAAAEARQTWLTRLIDEVVIVADGEGGVELPLRLCLLCLFPVCFGRWQIFLKLVKNYVLKYEKK